MSSHVATASYSIPAAQDQPSSPSDDYWDTSVDDASRYASWQATRELVLVNEMIEEPGTPAFPTALARTPSGIAVAMRDSNAVYMLTTDDDGGSSLALLAGSGR